jgi:hypothetical protein
VKENFITQGVLFEYPPKDRLLFIGKNRYTLIEINKTLDVLYFTDYEKYKAVLDTLSRKDLISIQEILRHERANDPNFSYAKERVTCILAGFDHHELSQKHGLDSNQNGETKPESLIEGGKKRELTGNVAFADMEINKINSLYENDTTILSSGFVGSVCLYVVGIKMKNDLIRNRLLEQHEKLSKEGKRKVLSFSRTHYADDPRNVLYFIHPKFDEYKEKMGTPHYSFIKGLQNTK